MQMINCHFYHRVASSQRIWMAKCDGDHDHVICKYTHILVLTQILILHQRRSVCTVKQKILLRLLTEKTKQKTDQWDELLELQQSDASV